MKPLIDPIATPDGLFHGKNTQTGELATIVTPKYANDNQAALLSTQREILTILAAGGIKADEATNDQFLTALKKVFLTTNDTRLDNLLHSDKNLADVKDKAAARTSLELKGAAVLGVGITKDTVAAGDDARITGALQKGNNLSEITAAGVPAQTAARVNLGLKTGAVHDVQPTPTDVSPEMLLKMGSFGLGIPMAAQGGDFHTWLRTAASGFYYLDAMQNAPESPAYILVLRNPKGDGVGALTFGYEVGQMGFDSFVKGKWLSWKMQSR
ncbi:hypothetical protein [Cedecea sp. NFIX57]|uniref:hypothetical protein n=1 Tax=Cedecea sp. NFIX57 TaxID=1566286 RepID=UPI000A0BE33E|nr:hypothetical protein [Cedecea sp. NFIX57]SMG61877.1 hypothetical protein SAMN03159353_10705 [Cedecea sp. NFIX57]